MKRSGREVNGTRRLLKAVPVGLALTFGSLTIGALPAGASPVTVSGTISDNAGNPIEAIIEVGPATVYSDQNGEYSAQVAPGTYNFEFYDAGESGVNGYFQSSGTQVTVTSDTTINATVPTLTTLDVSVVDSNNNPVQNATVGQVSSATGTVNGLPNTIHFAGEGSLQTCVTSASGDCTTPALVGGQAALTVDAPPPNGAPLHQTVAVKTVRPTSRCNCLRQSPSAGPYPTTPGIRSKRSSKWDRPPSIATRTGSTALKSRQARTTSSSTMG